MIISIDLFTESTRDQGASVPNYRDNNTLLYRGEKLVTSDIYLKGYILKFELKVNSFICLNLVVSTSVVKFHT